MEKQSLIYYGKSIPWRQKITIEPMVVLYTTAQIISQNLQLNLMLEKACRVQNERDQSCQTEAESQVLVSQINSWKLFFTTILMVLFTTVTGPIIDKNPRRLAYIVIIPLAGQFLCDLGNHMSVYFWRWHPVVNGIFEAVLVGFSGSNMGFTMVCLSFISYTSTKRQRTVRIGYYFFCVCVGSSLGYFCGGFATDYLGYFYGFIVCLALNLLAILMGFRSASVDILSEENHANEDTTKDITVCRMLQNNLEILTKRRDHGKKLVVILCVILYPIVIGYPAGELSVIYLFLRRQFSWNAVDYGVYMSFKMILKSCGAFLCAELLKRRLNLHDATIGIIGCTLQVTMSILWTLVAYSWQVYAVTALGSFEKGILSVLTSLASKCVEPYEYGRLSALFGLTYIIKPLVYPLYNVVYESSIYTFPSSFFLISIGFTTLMLLIFLYFCVSSVKKCLNKIYLWRKMPVCTSPD